MLPMISDKRFPPDTIFLIAEEDWRLWRDNCRRGGGMLPTDIPPQRSAELSTPAGKRIDPWGKGKGPAAPGGFLYEGKGKRPREERTGDGPRTFGRAKKPRPTQFMETSQELLDILHMVNVAHRHAHGDLVWLSYMVSQKVKWAPSFWNHSSQLFCRIRPPRADTASRVDPWVGAHLTFWLTV